MRAFYRYLRDFIKNDFDSLTYLYTALFLFIAIAFNYQYDFMNGLMNSYLGTWEGVLYGTGCLMVAYYGVAIPKLLLAGEFYPLLSLAYYLRTLFLISMLGVGIFSSTENWVVWGQNFWAFSMNSYERYFIFFNVSHLKFFITWTFASFLMYVGTQRYFNKPLLYGVTFRGFNVRLYGIMFLFMLPLLYFASLQEAFLVMYPLLEIENLTNVYQLSLLEIFLIFEFIYAFAFIGTEILFRGAFVLGLLDLVDHHTVLPMASIYCVIHFNKPMLEAISAIFGGYILGVLALATFNVLGGILIHVAIAWAMDLFSILRKGIIF